jgi:hypothetical protein
VGAVGKAMGRGGCPWVLRREDRGGEKNRDAVVSGGALLTRRRGEAGEGSGVGRCVEGGEAREGRPGPDRRGIAQAAWRVRTGEAPVSLTRETRPTTGEGGRREVRGPTPKKRSGPRPDEQESL